MNLSDHFLIAMPQVEDPFFGGSVVYMCRHDGDGAMGVVVNKPSPVMMELVFEAAASATPERFAGQSVMMGGPVQIDRGFVLHSPPGNWQSSLLVSDEVALTSSRDIIEQFTETGAVRQALVSIGYAAWQAGQLERELADNAWLTVAADREILFELPYGARYQAALDKLGVNAAFLMKRAGHA
ncbi:YqgE/AlgH family protein [Neisseria leonii]|uniref:YqgE/AlgH family protein n=1 Tax=Neisseria leonii TaxID=2995413 RepID=UPI00237B86F0|nr:YqgE/AlgH family protein [Neisseria sp. 3986]MDD9325500.1 YqgE/AlgH family protein [Neisseria sp. 3986]